MKTLKELLDEAGVSQEAQTKLQELCKNGHSSGKDLEIIVTNNGEYVSGKKYEDAVASLNDYKTKLDEANGKLTEKDTEIANFNAKQQGFQEEIDKLKAQASDFRKKAEIEKLFIKDDIPSINGNYDAYISGINLSEVTIDENGVIKNVNEVYNGFKERNSAFYTKLKTEVIDPVTPPPTSQKTQLDKEAFKKMSLDDRIKLKAENPTLYESISK